MSSESFWVYYFIANKFMTTLDCPINETHKQEYYIHAFVRQCKCMIAFMCVCVCVTVYSSVYVFMCVFMWVYL